MKKVQEFYQQRDYGKKTQETIEGLLSIHGNSADVAAIGPAGKAGVRFASNFSAAKSMFITNPKSL